MMAVPVLTGAVRLMETISPDKVALLTPGHYHDKEHFWVRGKVRKLDYKCLICKNVIKTGTVAFHPVGSNLYRLHIHDDCVGGLRLENGK